MDKQEEAPTEVHLSQSIDHNDQKPVDKQEETAERSGILHSLPFTMDMKNLPIRELLEYFLKTKCDDAWKEFERKIQGAVKGGIGSTLPAQYRQEAEDLRQDTMQRLIDQDYRRLRNLSWPHEKAIFGFVRVIACHTTIDWIRANVKFDHDDINEPTIINQLMQKGDTGDSTIANEQLEKIDKYLLSRTSRPFYMRDRAIFWFYYRWGLTDKQIAGRPGIDLSRKQVENKRSQLLIEVKRNSNEKQR